MIEGQLQLYPSVCILSKKLKLGFWSKSKGAAC